MILIGVVLRIYVTLTLFQLHQDLEAGDTQFLKSKWQYPKNDPEVFGSIIKSNLLTVLRCTRFVPLGFFYKGPTKCGCPIEICLSVRLCVFASVRLKRNGYVHFTVPRCDTFTKLTQTVHLETIYWYHMMFCVLDLHFTLQWPWLGRNG